MTFLPRLFLLLVLSGLTLTTCWSLGVRGMNEDNAGIFVPWFFGSAMFLSYAPHYAKALARRRHAERDIAIFGATFILWGVIGYCSLGVVPAIICTFFFALTLRFVTFVPFTALLLAWIVWFLAMSALASDGQHVVLTLVATPMVAWNLAAFCLMAIMAENAPRALFRTPGRCAACDYDMRGLAYGAVCPECGTEQV